MEAQGLFALAAAIAVGCGAIGAGIGCLRGVTSDTPFSVP